MKKKLVSALLVSAMAASMLVGCGDKGGSTEGGSANAGGSDAAGSVYMLNFKPESDQAWQDLAAIYTEQTGVEVNVLTAAEGQYNTTLTSEMSKGEEAPTIFNVGNSDAAKTWNDYTYDLTGSALYSHLSDKSLSINYDGKVAAVANCYECYGIIYNKTILEGYCGMDGAVVSSIDEIDSLDTLEAVAKDINDRVDEINEELGTDLTGAFASSGLDGGSSWRFSGHLAGVELYYEFKDLGCDLVAGSGDVTGKYMDNFKRVWDMYVDTSSADKATLAGGTYNAEMEFGMGEAVFFQNGNWEFSALTNPENGYIVTADDLGMMPIYFGVDDANQGLCVGTENYWAVNSQASQEDIDATLAFLEWVITSDEGRDSMVNVQGLSAPFDTFTGEYAPTNVFSQDNEKYAAADKTAVAWSFNATPNTDTWRAAVVAPLTAYTDGSGSWDDVEAAFVDSWATEWAEVHGE